MIAGKIINGQGGKEPVFNLITDRSISYFDHSHYKWEDRALGAMLGGLEDRDCGRPELPEPLQDEIDLKRKIEQLQREKELLEQKIELKDLIHEFELDRARKTGSKSVKKKKRLR